MKLVDGKKLEAVVKETVKKELPPEAAALLQVRRGDAAGRGQAAPGGGRRQAGRERARRCSARATCTWRSGTTCWSWPSGPNAKDAIQKAVASKPADVGVFQFQASLARIAPIIGDNAQQLAAARAAAEKVFGKGGSQADVIKFSIEGGRQPEDQGLGQGQGDPFLAEVGANEKKDQ